MQISSPDALAAPLMAIRRGFMASGISRTSSILSKPLSKVAPFTWNIVRQARTAV